MDYILSATRVTTIVYHNKACQSGIQENNRKIKHFEEQYDSLVRFKNAVSSSQGQFSAVNTTKKNLVTTLGGYSSECKTASKYVAGMNKVLNGIGVTYVNCTYSALLFTINLKLTEYLGKIRALEAGNALLNSQVIALSEQIRKEALEN